MSLKVITSNSTSSGTGAITQLNADWDATSGVTAILNKPTNATGSKSGFMSSADKLKLDGIENGAEVNNISDVDATDLTDGGNSTLHYHTADRNRANHTGTQTASTISDFATTVRATILTGLSTTTNAVITSADTVLSALGKLQKQISDNLTTLTNHTGDTNNPHGVTKSQVGLANVDNTSDVNKPVSTATQTALNLKANLTSPTFTGTPKAPTATAGTNTTQIATTAFVATEISNTAPLVHTHKGSDITVGRVAYYIAGTGSVAGTWLASEPDITSYYDGLAILYQIPIAGASTTTLNINGLGAKTIYRYGASKLTTHYPANSIILLIYSSTLNGGCFMSEGSDYDSTSDYELRWQNSITAGTTMYGYQIVMEGIDGKFYPLTLEGTTATTKTVASAEYRIGGTILYHGTSTDLPAGSNGAGSYLWSDVYMTYLNYTINNTTGWATAYRPVYLKGTVNASGNFVLDDAGVIGSTAWVTQSLPTTEDGKVYILLGFMNDTFGAFRLTNFHPIYEYRNGKLRLYSDVVNYTLPVASSSTLGGVKSGTDITVDASGNVSVVDDSHNHVISNVDGLQTALDSKLNSSSYTSADVLTKIKTVDGSGSGLDADLLDGVEKSVFLNSENNYVVHDTRSVDTPTDLGDRGVKFEFKGNLTDSLNDGGTYHSIITIQQWGDSSGGTTHQLGMTDSNNLWIRSATIGGTWGSWQKLWHTGNGGATSGLDADLLDGQEGSYYLSWANMTSKPTTLVGYGITDATPSSHVGSTGTAHGVATTSVNGFMSSSDKTKLNGVETNANNYVHPTTDGNLHVPATSTTNNGKFLKAGATAGSLSWSSLTATDVGLGNVTNESKATMFTSPTFTGTPTAPTPTAGDSSTKIATTAFVANAVSSGGGASKITGSITIPNTGWVANTGDYAYKLNLAISGMLATDSITVNITQDYLDVANACDMASYTLEYAGGTTLYAKSIPSASMSATYVIIR